MLIISSKVWLRSSLIFFILYFSASKSSSTWSNSQTKTRSNFDCSIYHIYNQVKHLRPQSLWSHLLSLILIVTLVIIIETYPHRDCQHLVDPDIEPLNVHLSILSPGGKFGWRDQHFFCRGSKTNDITMFANRDHLLTFHFQTCSRWLSASEAAQGSQTANTDDQILALHAVLWSWMEEPDL